MNDDERDGARQARADMPDDVSDGHVEVVQILTEVLTDILVEGVVVITSLNSIRADEQL